jgi:hypothetical protein
MRILLAGRFASPPWQGGASWAVLQYVLGFGRLGHEVLTVDPGPPEQGAEKYFHHLSATAINPDRAVLLVGSRRALGMAYSDVIRWARSADLVVNLSGCLVDEEILGNPGRRVYVDLDPAFTQLWHSEVGIDMGFSRHEVHVTVGQRIGDPSCDVPTCGVTWEHSLPPVYLPAWTAAVAPPSLGATTVANWRSYGSIEHRGVRYGQKAHSFRQLMVLPKRVPELAFEPAVAIDPGDIDDIEALDYGGWQRAGAAAVGDPKRFQEFVRASTMEVGVAKSGYVASGCGWFSDRSAAYLASARPVIAQDTGWTDVVPPRPGLLPFSDEDEAAMAIRDVLGDYVTHCRGARQVACELLDSDLVLSRLLDLAGA